jgi:hypothetical protein
VFLQIDAYIIEVCKIVSLRYRDDNLAYYLAKFKNTKNTTIAIFGHRIKPFKPYLYMSTAQSPVLPHDTNHALVWP